MIYKGYQSMDLNHVFTGGKHKGLPLGYVIKFHPAYIRWAMTHTGLIISSEANQALKLPHTLHRKDNSFYIAKSESENTSLLLKSETKYEELKQAVKPRTRVVAMRYKHLKLE